MNPFLAVGAVAFGTAFMVAAMLLLRTRAPEGGFFSDSDRASGVFGFLGAGFAIILGFVILVSFQNYSNAKQKAGDEAGAVSGQFEAAWLFADQARSDRLQADLVCYARSVIHDEWNTMADGEASPITEEWVSRMEDEIASADPENEQDAAAVDDWYDADEKRSDGRRERLLVSEEVLPNLLWAMLILGAALLIGYVFLYADSAERIISQAMLMGGVTALVIASMLVVKLLASPFQNEEGSILPSSMEYSLRLMEDDIEPNVEQMIKALCDTKGVALTK